MFCGALRRYFAGGPHAETAIFSIVIGTALAGYGLYGAFLKRNSEDQVVPKSKASSERLEEIATLKTKGLITEEEYAAKRQEILKDL